MSVATNDGPKLSPRLRFLSGFNAALLLFVAWHGSHAIDVQWAFPLTAGLASGWLALFGDRPGWSRRVTVALLVAAGLLGLAALGQRAPWV